MCFKTNKTVRKYWIQHLQADFHVSIINKCKWLTPAVYKIYTSWNWWIAVYASHLKNISCVQLCDSFNFKRHVPFLQPSCFYAISFLLSHFFLPDEVHQPPFSILLLFYQVLLLLKQIRKPTKTLISNWNPLDGNVIYRQRAYLYILWSSNHCLWPPYKWKYEP